MNCILGRLWAKGWANAVNKTNKSRSPQSRGLVWMAATKHEPLRAMTLTNMWGVLWGKQQGPMIGLCMVFPEATVNDVTYIHHG